MAIWGIVAFILPYYFYRDLLACLLVPAIWYGFILWQSRKLNYITASDYLQIKAPDLSPRPIRHHVGMISPDDYPGIVRALQSHGVKLVAL